MDRREDEQPEEPARLPQTRLTGTGRDNEVSGIVTVTENWGRPRDADEDPGPPGEGTGTAQQG